MVVLFFRLFITLDHFSNMGFGSRLSIFYSWVSLNLKVIT